MESGYLEFRCVGIENGGKIPIENTGRGQDIGYGVHRYAGPKPPKGKKHIYRFSIYALDCEMDLSSNSMKKAFLKKAQGHILQKGSITAEFE